MKFNSLFATLACLSFCAAPPAASACPPVALSVQALSVQQFAVQSFAVQSFAVQAIQPVVVLAPLGVVVQSHCASVQAFAPLAIFDQSGCRVRAARGRARQLGGIAAVRPLHGAVSVRADAMGQARARFFSSTVTRTRTLNLGGGLFGR